MTGWYTSTTLLAALASLTVVTVDIVRRFLQHRIERKGYPLPPGPTSLPFIGSVLSIDVQLPWLTYTEWRAKYGDIIYVRILDTDMIILNSTSVATELLEKRSRIYSDRPFIESADPYGWDFNFGMTQYGDHWRLCRRIFQQSFHSDASLAFRPLQLQKARELVCTMIDDHKDYPFHFHTFASSIVMSAVYDYDPSPRNDPIVSIIHKYMDIGTPGLAPGKWLLIKLFPFLLHVPDWLPGSWIRREAEEARAWKIKMVDTPYQYVKQRMEAKDDINAAMVSDHITRMEKFDDLYRTQYETALKHVSSSAFIGAVETTGSALMTFTLAMVENPCIWKRAQEAIDAVVGTERLPGYEDRSSLPFVDAIIRETLRWRPVTPIATPHAVTCSDIYDGYYIPKGATIIINTWAASRDEAQYPDAEKFIPERFLDAEGKLTDDDPGKYIFGFGRRKCPGRHIADVSLWTAIVTMLATLDFNLAKDEAGNDIAIKATFSNGIIDHPNPFPCHITPRPHVNKEALAGLFTK